MLFILQWFREVIKIERLDKIISNNCCISRSDARRLIKIGKVFVNSQRAKAFDTKVGETDKIEVDGKEISVLDEVYIIMNKPKGVVCDDKSTAPYVIDILPSKLKRKGLFCVGRLDKDTTGLLLITNNGEFAHSVISPKKHIEKAYRATLDEAVCEEDIKLIEKGITLKDGTSLMPARVKIISEDKTVVDIYIKEGKYHQIKRMAGAVGNSVVELKRHKIGNLNLPKDLCEGEAVLIDRETAFSALC